MEKRTVREALGFSAEEWHKFGAEVMAVLKVEVTEDGASINFGSEKRVRAVEGVLKRYPLLLAAAFIEFQDYEAMNSLETQGPID